MFNDFKSAEEATRFEFGGFKQAQKSSIVLYNGGGSGGGGGGGGNGGGSADPGSDS